MPERAQGALRQCLERHRRVRPTHRLNDLDHDLLAQRFADGPGGNDRGRALGGPWELALEDQCDQIRFPHLTIGDRHIGGRRVVVGEHDRAPCVCAQPMQHRSEIGITREDHKFIETRVMIQEIANVHHHANVRRVLELRRQWRAVDNLEAGSQEMMANEREGVHVRRIVLLIAARHGVAIAAVQDDAAVEIGRQLVGRRDQSAGFDLLQPNGGILREALGGFLVPALQRQVDVVVVDKHRRQSLPGLLLHLGPPLANLLGLSAHVLMALFMSRVGHASAAGTHPAYPQIFVLGSIYCVRI